jgi:hypothetical protein
MTLLAAISRNVCLKASSPTLWIVYWETSARRTDAINTITSQLALLMTQLFSMILIPPFGNCLMKSLAHFSLRFFFLVIYIFIFNVHDT